MNDRNDSMVMEFSIMRMGTVVAGSNNMSKRESFYVKHADGEA